MKHFDHISLATMLCLGTGVLGPAYGQQENQLAKPPQCAQFRINDKASTSLSPGSAELNACRTRRAANGFPLPDPKCTPGAFNPTLTAEVLRHPGFTTRCVRNDATTEAQKHETYGAYAIEEPPRNEGQTQTCELDHLVSLELGGADTLDNIWPQCGPSNVELKERYFRQKDMVEDHLGELVKTGRMDLAEAQRGIASDWTQYLEAAKETCSRRNCKDRD